MKNVISWVVNGLIFLACFIAGLFAFKGAYAEGNTLLAALLLFLSGGLCFKLIDWVDTLITNKK